MAGNLSRIGDVMSGGNKNISLFMIFLGFLAYWLKINGTYTNQSPFSITMSLFLFILAGYALANKMETARAGVFLPMLLFSLWYFAFGASYDPRFLIYFITISFVIIISPMLFSKGKSVMPELIGLLPVLFLFLDQGMLPFLIKKLNWPLTDLMKNLILYMPWWSFFGIFTLPSKASDNELLNFLVGSLKVAGIFYIVFMFVAPTIPTLGYNSSALPEIKELQKAQDNVLKKFPKTENPAWSNFLCTIKVATNPTKQLDVEQCIKDKQETSAIKYQCIEVKKLKKDTGAYKNCADKVKKDRKTAVGIIGTSDPTIKQPTTINLEKQFEQKTIFIKKVILLVLDFQLS